VQAVRCGRGVPAAVAMMLLVLSHAGCDRPAPPPPPPAPAPPPPPAPALPAGLTLQEHRVPGTAGQGGARVVAVVADPELTRLVVEAADTHPAGWRTSAPVASSTGALAVINGGYFSAASKPLGLVVSDGQRVNPLSHNSSPVLAVVDGRPRLLAPADVPDRGVSQAVQCGPRLVRDGQVTRLKESEPSRRSAVGLDAAGRLILAATVTGWLPLADFAEALVSLGCRDAMNLDGGPSTGFVVPGWIDADGPQPMPTHLLLLPRQDSARP